ncbi:MAG: helix-turn-helix transcriptional regulator [Oscillospiraceae bacterium]|nr:helix-turn-helix transcriptional regulator [Oscillospiraceae bacterium]
MLHQKVDLLLNALNAKGAEIASLTDSSPTSVSRLRRGARTPKMESPTIRRFSRGVVLFAARSGQTRKLRDLVHSPSSDTDAMIAAVAAWLYSDDMPGGLADSAEQREQFGERLHQLMLLAGMNNKALGQSSDTEYSYISRLHRGRRMPKAGSESLRRICQALYDRFSSDDRLEDVSGLLHIPAEEIDAAVLRDWLCGYSGVSTSTALLHFLDDLGKPPAPAPSSLSHTVVPNEAPYHMGARGLQEAVVRFLADVPPDSTILLYSDHPMDWMNGEHRAAWMAMMQRCLDQRVRIRIIHSVERDMPELLAAIESWMPLYMSGLIEPYYSTRSRGTRFRHTLLLCPGQAAVTGFSPEGTACEFAYVTEPERLAHLDQYYEALLKDSLPLLSVSTTCIEPADPATVRHFGCADVFLEDDAAVVGRTGEPPLSFRFLHPAMVRAFSDLLGQ